MTSLFRKLKDLVNASVRGQRHYQPKSPAPAKREEEGEATPVPEVTEASAHQSKLPEVTEAPVPAREDVARSSVEAVKIESAVEELQAVEGQDDALEEGRVADLLKGEE